MIVTRSGFGALPIQRRSFADAGAILQRAYDAGITFFDTARAYSDSEEKIGSVFSPAMRQRVFIATKTMAKNAEDFWRDLQESLHKLKTDYVDLYQFHNPPFMPKPGGEDGLYDAMLQARQEGKVRHIGITNHRMQVAREAAESGLYETLQYPFSLLCQQPDLELLDLCEKNDLGFIAMKGLSGGLLSNAAPAFAFIRQYPRVVPIWGIQRLEELEEFISFEKNPPVMDDAMKAQIQKAREELSGDFCRGCGYCLPCPAGIEINMAARIYPFITRSPYQAYITESYQARMAKVKDCIHCGACKSRCPYGLDTPELVRTQYALYLEFVKEHAAEVTP